MQCVSERKTTGNTISLTWYNYLYRYTG